MIFFVIYADPSKVKFQPTDFMLYILWQGICFFLSSTSIFYIFSGAIWSPGKANIQIKISTCWGELLLKVPGDLKVMKNHCVDGHQGPRECLDGFDNYG